MSQFALQKLKDTHGSTVLESHARFGDETAVVEASCIHAICNWLRDDPQLQFDMLTDLTAVDYLPQNPRFEVVYHFFSTKKKHRIRIKTRISEQDCELDTISDLWRNADWLEREVWDMYGIRFRGHHNLKRILMYEEFEGHPLRKDYPKEKRQPLYRRPSEEIAEAINRRSELLRTTTSSNLT